MTPTLESVPELLLGPVLRHVGRDTATVWVETSEPCTVTVLGCTERTWTVAGHHYALVPVTGISGLTAYEVDLDGDRVWPLAGQPPSVIRSQEPGRALRIVFGSCRFATPTAVEMAGRYDADALDAYARRLMTERPEQWPDALLLLGDQVYADDLSPQTLRRVAQRHDVTEPPGPQVRDFEEYTWLYRESWSDPEVRWLLSTVGSSMIFDDHDVHDDWNTSQAWVRDMAATDWWDARLTAALTSYWIYQHVGNLAPEVLAEDDLYQRIRGCDGDAEPILRAGVARLRWSYVRDLGATRLIMIDSRCGRVLDDDRRAILPDSEFDWLAAQSAGDYDHVLFGTSLPWLLPRPLQAWEARNERNAAGTRGPWRARLAEKIRRACDLEHWGAFAQSFDRLTAMIADIGARPHAPATVCVLSGDVHHAYAARAVFPESVRARVFQLTCSPMHNHIPDFMKVVFRVFWNDKVGKRFRHRDLDWRRIGGPYFGDQVATLHLHGRRGRFVLERADTHDDGTGKLVRVADLVLS